MDDDKTFFPSMDLEHLTTKSFISVSGEFKITIETKRIKNRRQSICKLYLMGKTYNFMLVKGKRYELVKAYTNTYDDADAGIKKFFL